MNSEEWLEENPTMSLKTFERFVSEHQLDDTFREECKVRMTNGRYKSAEVLGLAGY